MIAVLQRVSEARVTVSAETLGRIGPGLVVFLGVLADDGAADSEFLVDKISTFRIFGDREGKMNLSLEEVNGSVLVISQFTLCADWRKGRRPSFMRAAAPATGEALYEDFIRRLEARGFEVRRGRFGARMEVHLVNDGPVTFVLDSKLK